jgi:hypothetical protein
MTAPRKPPRPIKDWEPGFQAMVTELYRAGADGLAEEAERTGHVLPLRISRVGALVRTVLAGVHRRRHQPRSTHL